MYVRTGPVRRLPQGPPWPGHGPDSPVHDRATGELHWLTHRNGIVSCESCGPLGRQRRRDRLDPYGHRMRRRRRPSVPMPLFIRLYLWVVCCSALGLCVLGAVTGGR